MRFEKVRFQYLVRIVLAIALLFVAFSHAPAGSVGAERPELAAYVLPDGSVASLCLSGYPDKQLPGRVNSCEYCRLAAAVLLPEPVSFRDPLFRWLAAGADRPYGQSSTVIAVYSPATPLRGPPQA